MKYPTLRFVFDRKKTTSRKKALKHKQFINLLLFRVLNRLVIYNYSKLLLCIKKHAIFACIYSLCLYICIVIMNKQVMLMYIQSKYYYL